MSKDFKLDLFTVLEYLDKQNLGVYEELMADPELVAELEKSIGWLIQQWMTAAADNTEHMVLAMSFDEFCNTGWDQFSPRLQSKLLACCGLGKKVKHKFYRPKTSKTSNDLINLLQLRYPDIRLEEVELWVRKTTIDDAIELGQLMGYQTDQVKSVEASYRMMKDEQS